MRISAIDPIGRAMSWMNWVLFHQFSLGKWFVLGFCAFLAALGEGGTPGFHFQARGPIGGPGGQLPREVADWFSQNLPLVLMIGLVVLVLGLALGALLQWLGSRGKFMFLDGVVRNQAAVVEPWHRFRALGNSLFWVRLLFGLALSFAVLAAIILCAIIAWPDIRAEQFGAAAMTALLLGAGLLLPLSIVGIVVVSLLNDFVVPIMYRRGIKTLAAARVLREEILPGHVGVFVLFYLMKLVLGIAAGVIIVFVTCITCCIAALPYLSSVVFLPISVFMRSYSVFFLEQFGEEWRLTEGVGNGEHGVDSEGGDVPNSP